MTYRLQGERRREAVEFAPPDVVVPARSFIFNERDVVFNWVFGSVLVSVPLVLVGTCMHLNRLDAIRRGNKDAVPEASVAIPQAATPQPAVAPKVAPSHVYPNYHASPSTAKPHDMPQATFDDAKAIIKREHNLSDEEAEQAVKDTWEILKAAEESGYTIP